ncbi:MAG: maleylpyruvate isomerase N-terminal domain-containing protein [Chloroflexota bacterium]|nr:maleylpyruvate isomerase N-terminal domain-containing protein [Chloroflexota bacterium]
MAMASWNGERVTPEHLLRASTVCLETLRPVADRDWSIPAGGLTWTCRETIDHVADALSYYCGQLAGRRTKRVPSFRNGNPTASVPQLLEAVQTGALILADVARAAPADARGWHRMGMADAEGFLAMGCEEILIHTWDIAQGFGLEMTVPEELAAAVLARIFPWAPTGCSAWEAHLWCSDRITLEGRDRIGEWGWHAAPIGEWAGGDRSPVVHG